MVSARNVGEMEKKLQVDGLAAAYRRPLHLVLRHDCVRVEQAVHILLAFFKPFITGDIGCAYGCVSAGCNLAAVFVVCFFLPESSCRLLEENDTIILLEEAWGFSWLAIRIPDVPRDKHFRAAKNGNTFRIYNHMLIASGQSHQNLILKASPILMGWPLS